MEWLIPIAALLVGAIYLFVRLRREALRKSCAGCPFEDACPVSHEEKA